MQLAKKTAFLPVAKGALTLYSVHFLLLSQLKQLILLFTCFVI